MSQKDGDGIENTEGPDHATPWVAVWAGYALFAQKYMSRYLEFYGILGASFGP